MKIIINNCPIFPVKVKLIEPDERYDKDNPYTKIPDGVDATKTFTIIGNYAAIVYLACEGEPIFQHYMGLCKTVEIPEIVIKEEEI